jgi:hypothetical protein
LSGKIRDEINSSSIVIYFCITRMINTQLDTRLEHEKAQASYQDLGDEEKVRELEQKLSELKN